MFTGIIEEIGIIKNINRGRVSAQIHLSAVKVLEGLRTGDSICINGVCLTVTEFSNQSFIVDVMPQTLRLTNLHDLNPGDEVNLERALAVNDRLGGHMVSGHIDGIGKIIEYNKEDNARWVTISAEPEIMRYIIAKGSVSIDGISLTVAERTNHQFKVSIIPHTGMETTLLKKKIGGKVNIECDMVGKYIEHFMSNKSFSNSKIDLNFLQENGFLGD